MTATALRGPAFRPQAARWFELLTVRDDVTGAVEALARTHLVQLDARSEQDAPAESRGLHAGLAEFNRLAQRFAAYWPVGQPTTDPPTGDPETRLEAALARLRAWRAEAEPVITALEALRAEQAETALVADAVEACLTTGIAPGDLAAAGFAVAAQLFALPARFTLERQPAGVITRRARGECHEFLLAVGTPEALERFGRDLALAKARPVPLPGWLAGNERPREAIAARRIELERGALGHQGRLAELREGHGLAEALGDIERLEWFLVNVRRLPATENFAWVTGWTAAPDPAPLQAALDAAAVRGLLRFTAPPAGRSPPLLLRNPAWAQPFELFARLLGTPSAEEADPTRLLALFVPLLFGYMFGDLGQGAVLLVLGLTLGRRYPTLRLLVPGGAAAMLFGLLYGSVFGIEGLLPPLWLAPLSAPLLVLTVPLAAGVVILTLGQLLNGIEWGWRGEGRAWWGSEAPILVVYLSLLASPWWPPALAVALAALIGLVAAQRPTREPARLGAALGHLAESLFQLAANTLSFARVGAFALAHAGLATAVAALAGATGDPIAAAVVLVLGNGVIILLEGLIVAVQVTRLVLFEFFVRFLRAEGRRFEPLAAPPRHDNKKGDR